MDLEDFLPTYPDYDYDPLFSIYPEDISMTEIIQQKKEFKELTLQPREDRPEKGELLQHQLFLQRFLSGHTPYNGILLWHSVGTGKTGSAIAIAEGLKFFKNSFKKALVLVRSDTFIRNFKNEIAYVMTKGEYLPKESRLRPLTDNERNRRINKLLSTYYEFNTFQKFSKSIEEMTETVKNFYSNRVVIIDEVHNLRESSDDEGVYRNIHNFLHTIEGCKVVLLTATPIKDKAPEFSSIMNLILPLDKQLPVDKAFMDEYFEDGVIPVNKQKQLIRLLKGRVSYLQSSRSDVVISEAGSADPKTGLVSVNLPLSDYQLELYAEAYKKDSGEPLDDVKEKSGIYQNSRAATLCVSSRKGRDFSIRALKDKIAEKKTQEERLEVLKIYSAKYHYIINHLLTYPERNCFVYCRTVSGEGVEALAEILSLFSFQQAVGSEAELSVPSRRFCLITGQTNQAVVEKNLANFNRPENYHGQYIQLVIGSAVIGEGRSLLSVRDIVIVSPHWNFTDMDQAIGRGIRFGSHRYLPQSEKGVSIHRLSIISENSIDRIVYEMGYKKDILSKEVEAVARTAAVDCMFNILRNKRVAEENSRECLYRKCDYVCAFPQEEDEKELVDTYNLFYTEKEYQAIKKVLQEKFAVRFEYHLSELLSDPEISSFSPIVALRSITSVIQRKEAFLTPLGFTGYLKERDGLFFLVYSQTLPPDFSYLYDTKQGQVRPVLSFEKYMKSYSSSHLEEIIEKISERLEENRSEAEIIYRAIEEDIKEELVRESIYKKYFEKSSNPLYEFIVSKQRLVEEEDMIQIKREILDLNTGEWRQKVVDMRDRETKLEAFYENVRENKNKGADVYGILDDKNNLIKISNFDSISDAASKGLSISSATAEQLSSILDSLIKVTGNPIAKGTDLSKKKYYFPLIEERLRKQRLLIKEKDAVDIDNQSLKKKYDAKKEESEKKPKRRK